MTPCNLAIAESAIVADAVMDRRPRPPGVFEPVEKLGSLSIVPSNPNSRLGRTRSPLRQGRDRMDALVIGIDVSKAQLDVHVRPSEERFAVARTGAGLDELVARLKAIAPAVIAVEGHRSLGHRLSGFWRQD